MATFEDAVVASLGLIAAILYGVVARIQARRHVSATARPALNGFVLWWAGLAVLGVATMFFTFVTDFSASSINVVRLVIYGLFGLIFVMCAGLVHYLLYLYTGRRAIMYVAYGFYAVLFLYMVWLIEAHAPHVAMGHMGTPQEGEVAFHLHQEPSAIAGAVLSLGLILPLFGAAVAYALLFFRSDDATTRYRIAMVSSGFVLWFTFSLFNTVIGIVNDSAGEQSLAVRIAGQLLGVMAAVLTLLAFHPPAGIRRRLGLRRIDAPSGPGPLPPPRVATV